MILILRWILLPISLIYQLIVWIRNRMFDLNILKSKSFDIPTIVIGNLAIGGAGKSPMTEYLIHLLKDKYTVATLSRGYGRKTKGFKYVNIDSTAIEVGDEPMQFKNKFPEITVAVSEDRCKGIDYLQKNNEVVLLDDAFQHRKLKAGFYMLLFDFNSLFEPHLLLPTGNFRDNFSSTKRADIVIITKCPSIISIQEKNKIEHIIRRYTTVPLFYSSIIYKDLIPVNNSFPISFIKNYDIVLFCGIANPSPLVKHLKSINNNVHLLTFSDHHNYTINDFENIKNFYNKLESNSKIILTTEKDSQRINKEYFIDYPLYYIPISININNYNDIPIDSYIETYINQTINTNKYE